MALIAVVAPALKAAYAVKTQVRRGKLHLRAPLVTQISYLGSEAAVRGAEGSTAAPLHFTR